MAAPAPEGLRRCVALQVERARELLAHGDALCARLHGLARPVVAGYAAGGWATAAALERADFDPNSRPVRPRRIATLRHALRVGVAARRARVSARAARSRWSAAGSRARRGARVRGRGRARDAVRGARVSRRRDLVDREARPARRQRPARVHALLHGLSRSARAARRRGPRLAAAAARGARRRAGPAARVDPPPPAARARASRAEPARVSRTCRSPRGCARRRSRARFAALDPDDARLDERSLGSWLAERGVRDAASLAFWDLLIRPTLNVPAADASLALAARVLRTGFLDRADAADIGSPRCRSPSCTTSPRGARCERRAPRVALRAAVRGVERSATRRACIAARWAANRCAPMPSILAAPPDSRGAARARRAGLDAAALAPARRVADREPARLVRPPRHRPAVRRGLGHAAPVDLRPHARRGRASAASCSRSRSRRRDEWLGQEPRRAARGVRARVPRAVPGRARGAGARLLRAQRARGDVPAGGRARGALRPAGATRHPAVYVAGAWTDTGWPATMEGAVRSGTAAARGGAARARSRAARGGGMRREQEGVWGSAGRERRRRRARARGARPRGRAPARAPGRRRLLEGRARDERDDGRRGPADARVPRHPHARGDRARGELDPLAAARRRQLGQLLRRARRPLDHDRGLRGAAARRAIRPRPST